MAAATGEAATAAVAATTGEAATTVATTTAAAEATTAVATATAAAAEAATAVATATATAATTTASLCNSIGRGEGDADCRHSGKKSDLSGHGTTPRIGIAPCKFNTTHANLFRSRNVSPRVSSFCEDRTIATICCANAGLIEEDVYATFPELKPEGPFSVVWRRGAVAKNENFACRLLCIGTFETCRLHRAMSGFGSKAEDICSY